MPYTLFWGTDIDSTGPRPVTRDVVIVSRGTSPDDIFDIRLFLGDVFTTTWRLDTAMFAAGDLSKRIGGDVWYTEDRTHFIRLLRSRSGPTKKPV